MFMDQEMKIEWVVMITLHSDQQILCFAFVVINMIQIVYF